MGACNDGALGGTAFDPSTWKRKIELVDTDRTTVLETLCDLSAGTNVVTHCDFEWLRQGGCGGGTLQLAKGFDDDIIETGQYIRCSYDTGEVWYLGRVEEVTADEPSGQSVRMYGLISLLNDLPLGGLGSGDCRGPHLFAPSDYFPNDPDRGLQSWDVAANYTDLAQFIYDSYIDPETAIGLDNIESPNTEIDLAGFVFRGEEMVGQVLRALATVQYGCSYGVDPNGNFFWINPRDTGLARYRQGSHVTALSRSTDRSLLVNRVFLTGDNVYEQDIFTAGLIDTIEKLLDAVTGGDVDGVKPYRYQKAYCDEASIALWGPKTRMIHLPWIRNDDDAQAFIDGFLGKYSSPLTRYTFTTIPQGEPLYPWLGYVCLQDSAGNTLSFDQFDRVKVTFNEAPYFEVTTGPEEIQFPEPPERQRFPQINAGNQSSASGASTTISDSTAASSQPQSSSLACQDFQEGMHYAQLTATLNAATDMLTGATTATAKFLEPDGLGDLELGCTFTVTNRWEDLSLASGKKILVRWLEQEQEWAIVASECP